jgi:hypothetical protein
MADKSREVGDNPPLVIGAPVPPPSLGECMACHAYYGTLGAFLIDIGYYYYHPAPRDRDPEGRDR